MDLRHELIQLQLGEHRLGNSSAKNLGDQVGYRPDPFAIAKGRVEHHPDVLVERLDMVLDTHEVAGRIAGELRQHAEHGATQNAIEYAHAVAASERRRG